jgi:hypothetical protein
VSDDGVQELAGLTALTTLNLCGCYQGSSYNGLRKLAGLTALTTLNLDGCELLSDDLRSLAGLVTALTSLNLDGCAQPSDSGLHSLLGLTALPIALRLLKEGLVSGDELRALIGLPVRGISGLVE